MKQPVWTFKALTLFNALLSLFSLVVPFLASGNWYWWQAWVWAGVCLLAILISRIVALRINPGLARERLSAAEQANTQVWDKFIVPWIGVYLPFFQVLFAGLDQRWYWSAPFPLPLTIIGLVFLLFGYALGTWAMAVNAYFSYPTWLQPERGQVVVNTGPYRFVRHPAYSGGIFGVIGVALLLGSWWAFVPALVYTILVFVRTGLEDRFLIVNLPGYAEFSKTTRFRLFPGIW